MYGSLNELDSYIDDMSLNKDLYQKFGRLVGVNLEIRAFATDPQELQWEGKHELPRRECDGWNIPMITWAENTRFTGYKEQNTDPWCSG